MAKAPVQEDRSLSLVPLSQLPERSVGWLWRGRLAFGKLAILDGDPGMGKTLLALDICVRATTGKAFPGDIPAVGPVNVMLLNAEDAMEDTIKPRLRAMGADLDRVFAIDEEQYDLSQALRFPGDRDILDRELARTKGLL